MRRIRYVLTSCACVAFLTAPGLATGQPRVFIEGSLKLSVDSAEWCEGSSERTEAVTGTYGDEGVRIGAALDKMATGLAKWDRTIQEYEIRMASGLQGGAPLRAVFLLHVTMAGLYLDRGR